MMSLYYRYYIWRYGIPCRMQMRSVLEKYYATIDLNEHRTMYKNLLIRYGYLEHTVEELAEHFQSTRERIRQRLLKITRDKPDKYWYRGKV